MSSRNYFIPILCQNKIFLEPTANDRKVTESQNSNFFFWLTEMNRLNSQIMILKKAKGGYGSCFLRIIIENEMFFDSTV